LPIARLLIRSLWLGDEVGPRQSFGLSFDMADIFQDAFARSLERWSAAVQPQKCFHLTLENSQPLCFRPDVMVPHQGRLFVLDTKWKALMPAGSGGSAEYGKVIERPVAEGKLMIKTADVSQILSWLPWEICG